MVDSIEWTWVREKVLDTEAEWDHLVLCSTLPWMMLPGVHHMEGWNEAVAQGAWGKYPAKFGEWFRQFLDLEHWAAFRESFDETTDLLGEAVRQDGAPASILMLSGDVHCSYTARAELTEVDHPDTDIHQLTMSPFRNDIEKAAKRGNLWLNHKRLASAMHRLAKWAKVDDVDMTWQVEHGPWFDNGVMTITFDRRSAVVDLEQAHVTGRGEQVLDHALTYELTSAPVPVDEEVATAED
jgi:hypothetical protein